MPIFLRLKRESPMKKYKFQEIFFTEIMKSWVWESMCPRGCADFFSEISNFELFGKLLGKKQKRFIFWNAISSVNFEISKKFLRLSRRNMGVYVKSSTRNRKVINFIEIWNFNNFLNVKVLRFLTEISEIILICHFPK